MAYDPTLPPLTGENDVPWYKKLDRGIDSAFEFTGIPQLAGNAAGAVGEGFDALFNTNIAPTVENVGQGLPRAVVESLLTIPLAASGAGTPAAGAIWANRLRKLGQVAGYASAATKGYAETDSPLGALIGAGSLGVGNYAIPAVGSATENAVMKFLTRNEEKINPALAADVLSPRPTIQAATLAENLVPGLSKLGAEVGAATALNEGTRQAMMSVGPEAVAWDDPARNPLTAENIASNVAGAVAFAPQFVTSFLRPRRTILDERAKAFSEWSKQRHEANIPYDAYDYGDFGSFAETAKAYDEAYTRHYNEIAKMSGAAVEGAPVRQSGGKVLSSETMDSGESTGNVRAAVVENLIQAYGNQRRNGDPLAAETKQKLIDILSSPDSQDAFTGTDTRKKTAAVFDDIARSAPPSTPEKFRRYIDDVNAFIDDLNANALEADPTAKPIRRVKFNDVITDFQRELDQSGDPEFAYRTTIQKIANRLPSALSEESAIPPVTQPKAPEVGATLPVPTDAAFQALQEKQRARMSEFVEALARLPDSVREFVSQRTAELVRFGSFFRKDGPAGGMRDVEYSRMPNWQKVVILAAETYNPEDGTISMFKRSEIDPVTGKKKFVFERKPISTLVEKTEDGKYVWNPASTPLTVEEGRGRQVVDKNGKKVSREVSLEQLRPDEPRVSAPAEVMDEEAFKAGLGEVGTQRAATEHVGEGSAATLKDREFVPEKSTEGDGKDIRAGLKEETKALKEKLPEIRKRLETLTDEQIAAVVKPAFGQGFDARTGRTSRIRNALLSVLEDLVTEEGKPLSRYGSEFITASEKLGIKLADERSTTTTDRQKYNRLVDIFFRSDAPVEGGKSGKAVIDRVGKALELLGDERRVKAAMDATTVKSPLASGGTVDQQGHSIFVNTQPEGRFGYDAVRTLRDFFTKTLGDEGYGGSLRDTLTEMAVTIARQMDGMPVDFYRLASDESQGLAWVDKNKRGKVGLGLNEKTAGDLGPIIYANNVLQTLAHEIAHIDSMILHDMISAPDAFSARRKVQLQSLFRLSDTLTPDERNVILGTIYRALTPDEARVHPTLPGSDLLYGSQNSEEFVATLNGMIVQSLVAGKPGVKKTVQNVFDYSPEEVRDYVKGTYRTIGDVVGAASEAVKQGSGKGSRDQRLTADALFAAAVSAKEASRMSDVDYAVMQGKHAVGMFSPGAAAYQPLPPSPAYWFREKVPAEVGAPVEPLAMARLTDAVGKAHEAVTGADGKGQYATGLWGKLFTPFSQLMHSMDRAGVPLARPVMKLAMELEPSISRRRTNLLHPFITPDKAGGYKLDPDSALVRLVSEDRDGPWRKAVNAVSDWQNRNGTQPMFIRDQKGVVTVNDAVLGAREQWERMSKGLSPERQHQVMSASVAMDEVGQAGAAHLTQAMRSSLVNKTAMVLLASQKGMTYDAALVAAGKAFDYTLGAQQAGVMPDFTALGVDPVQAKTAAALLAGPEGLVTRFQEVMDRLAQRKGWRTEMLPGEWIVRFKNRDGATKFLSAETQKKAEWLLEKTQKEEGTQGGSVAEAKTLREYTDFDSPDALLMKFSAVEAEAYRKFREKVETDLGAEAAARLDQYVPGAATTRDRESVGMAKYLKERQNRVDTSRYDYVEGMMSWTGRLAAGIEYKNATQMKDLILADPRAQQFPEFRAVVEPHFENMMSPTSELTRKLKTFASGYFMAGSVASTAMNGTQTVMTLVPALIQLSKTGGPMEAYGLLGNAVKTATKFSLSTDWQKTAEAARLKNPKFWTLEEAQAWAYKRSIDEGGITQGVIHDDILSPNDQKKLMLTKFGRGDPGPVSVGELVTNAAFVGTQLAMKPFGWVEGFNNKIAIAAAVEQGWKQGLRKEDLADHARLVRTLANFGGGKANAPGFVGHVSNDFTRPAVALLTTLQQYGFGVVSAYAQYGKEALGLVKNLSPQERRQAQKAFATMLTTQTALAGALGLPFAGASLAVLEKVFGIQANAAVREGLASLGADDETGAMIAETALNGLGNQLFGLDVSSRLGVSNLLGTSAYRGFNLADLAGPVGGIVGGMVDGLSLFAQGEPERAMKALVPAALKNVTEVAGSQSKYGDSAFRDTGGNLLMQPTTSQTAWYLAGFRPQELSAKRQAQGLLRLADEQASQETGRMKDGLGRALVAGNPSLAMQKAQELRFADPTMDPKEFLRSVVRKSVDGVFEKDLLATGGAASEAERSSIAKTFGPGVVTRQSEVSRAVMETQLGVQLGLSPDTGRLRRAALVDLLVAQRGMPRSEALRFAEFLSGGVGR